MAIISDLDDSVPLITLKALSKSFGGHQALKNIDLTLHQGEVHCLAGANGCGKSTLIKTISGVYAPDDGSEIIIDDKSYTSLTPDRARKMGIQVIYQDLSLFPNLTAAENIAFEYNLKGYLGWFSGRKIKQGARKILEELQFNIDPDALVQHLPIAQRQQVAICRALVADARLVIMDEPTASLTRTEVNQLLRTVNYLRDRNITVVFVSHRLDEVKEISDRITVIRDGEKVGTWPAQTLSTGRITELMTGLTIVHERKLPNAELGKEVLRLERLSRKGQFQDVSFSLHRGEVLGLCGLLGAGRTELALSLFGITHPHSGDIYIDGKKTAIKDNTYAIEMGIGYVSEDRLTLGAVLPQSVADNMVLSILKRIRTPFYLIDQVRQEEMVREWIKDLDIKVSDLNNPLATLSGGNQQKVVLAKWILTRPKVLILDAPTVGVDIGAKDSIYKLIHRLSGVGIAVLLITDEVPEAYYNCDRILHMKQGKILHELFPAQITEQQCAEAING
ncbi:MULTISPECIES: sugar ABC transporter ATP-binding protein [unclassified Brenneria]|uniref:sugar ABC transporter ATP-binding protein n=1 Tax=unclassified Brenneria TaxID=2634434 RepID=UPI0029C313C0|nr:MULTISPECIES: sugar ABC transporter ATP-binding protein [unclassified Brenneria]MDX5629194.1 sugar ABC transporter ATP-binding protein [Brenneria sp. L3-3Z]MDX5696333.1 sugar ABC transporter ATP-binding protein [Brenneria sp. L4-2C]MEE3662800.1 sugar ABC transporter ATP-binding protein [Brenneria sp. g21c3]